MLSQVKMFEWQWVYSFQNLIAILFTQFNFLSHFYLSLPSTLFEASIPAAPENITVTFINPTSVRVSWQQPVDLAYPIEKYDVTYKPTDAR
jgi:hypothetical protein